MKLELKHLAPYLPYGLKIDTSKLENGCSIMTMCDKVGLSNISISDVIDKHPYTKPILRPLSDLTNRINPVQHHTYLDGLVYSKIEFVEKAIHNETLFLCDYNYLMEYHFDVFGLIGKGLAIDINTLYE